eukprot:CCRYP_002493-RA/>CCRYP_002493-RA protein AED:0.26 eAED:0.26 QI:0/0/0/1/0/0.5/2/0/577
MIWTLLVTLLSSPFPCSSFHLPTSTPIASLTPHYHDHANTRSTSAATTFHSRSSTIPRMSQNNNNDDDDDDNIATNSKTPSLKLFELEKAFEDDGENVVGTKFFGGNAVKEELYVPEEEERAAELQNVKREADEASEYRRFEDGAAFDALGKRVGVALQCAINALLYGDDSNNSIATWKEDAASFSWETPFQTNAKTPLAELAASKSFYNQLDVAILSAKTLQPNTVQIRWDIGAVWPNPWESRILLTGTSTLTVRDDVESNTIVLTKQVDRLDGTNPTDILGSLSSQLPPRFWDMYHIGMTPSAELDPRYTHVASDGLAYDSSKNIVPSTRGKRGMFSSYRLSYLPSRIVTEPSLIDTNGRDVRMAQALPNHGFTTAIKTMGPNKESFVPVSPIEVSISKSTEGEGSLITWSVPLPPQFASRLVLPLPSMEGEEWGDDDDGDNEAEEGPTKELATANLNGKSPLSFRRITTPRPDPPKALKCNYALRPNRLVATLPYGGNPQDEEVTQLRRQLYQEVVERDGFRPKLDPVTQRPIFFFWMNDAKACFTREGGLGMAVYEWRADWAKSNEVGIELEL